MTEEQFESLVSRLEVLAARDLAAYKVRVALLALLGYGYVIAVLMLIFALCAGLVVLLLNAEPAYEFLLKLSLPLSVLTFLIYAAFWMRLDSPTGVPVSANDSPKIFELVKELKGKLACPKIDAVYLNADFNASIYSAPRLGFLGMHKHYLYLGLPLMQSLSPEQFKAVVAHELGHLSANHGRFASWIYSVRATAAWIRAQVRKRASFGTFLFQHFIEWYYPYFSAYSFVLMRQHEYEADKCAVEVSGARTAALSLINCQIKNKYVDLKYWKELFKGVADSPEPPSSPFRELSQLMIGAGMDPDAYKWYQQALRRRTILNESHPALFDRIKAMAENEDGLRFDNLTEDELRDAWRIETSAAQEYFQSGLSEYERRMDLAWHSSYDLNWQLMHSERIEGLRQLTDFETLKQKRDLTNDELIHYCQLYVQLKSVEEAILVLKEAVQQLPENVAVNYNLGERLLANGDSAGIIYLEKVISMKPVYGHDLCEMIYQHLMDDGKEQDAKIYLERLFSYKEELQLAARERAGLKPSDRYRPHKMPDRELAAIVAQLANYPAIVRAYLVCKDVTTLSDRPFYVLIVDIRFPWFKLVGFDDRRKIVASLSKVISMPSEGYVIELELAPRNLVNSLRSFHNSQVYLRKQIKTPTK